MAAGSATTVGGCAAGRLTRAAGAAGGRTGSAARASAFGSRFGVAAGAGGGAGLGAGARSSAIGGASAAGSGFGAFAGASWAMISTISLSSSPRRPVMIWTVSARIRSERSPRSESASVAARASAAWRSSLRLPRRRRVGGWSSSTSSRLVRRTAGPGASPGSSTIAGASGARRPSASGRARRRKRCARSPSGAGSLDVSAAMRASASSGISIASPRSARRPKRRTAAAATTAVRSPPPPLASRPSIQAAATIRSSTSAGMVGNHSPATVRSRMRPRRSARVSVSPITPPRIPRTLALFAGLECRFPPGAGKGTHRSPECHLSKAQDGLRACKPPRGVGIRQGVVVVISRHANGVLSLRGGKARTVG